MISILADWITLLGFGLTIWILITTRGLKKSFLSRARLPELREDLTKVNIDLLKSIRDGDTGEISLLCAKIEATLSSAKTKVDGDHKKRISKLLTDIEDVRFRKKFNMEFMRPIHDELTGVTEMLINLEKDVSWRA